MAEEFQAGICGGNWWSVSRNALLVGGGGGGGGGASPCSVAFNDVMGNYGWLTDVVDAKGMKSCDDNLEENNRGHTNTTSYFPSNSSSHDKDYQPTSCGSESILIDSTLHMMGFGLSSSSTTSDWSQTLLGRTDQGNYNSMIQEDMSSRLAGFDRETGMDPSQIQKEWSPKSFCNGVAEEDSSLNGFKQINQDFSMDQTRTNPIISTANNCASSCGYPLTLIQSLLDPDPNNNPHPPLYNNQSMSHLPTANYGLNNDNSPASFSKLSPLLKPPSLANKQQPNRLHFSNNAPFWNASTTGLDDIRTGFLAQPEANCSNLMKKPSPEDGRDSDSSIKKSNTERGFKRPRIEAPSPLPTFKVRKEKLGDRITALQQLVSPFGKTDTASVLHEAIDYIKFLHDQVSVLSAPYMKNGSPQQHQQGSDKLNDTDGPKQDLRSRGLCLVPVSSTFPVANETPVDFWTPTFGGTFR